MHSRSCFWFLVWSQSLADRRLALWKAEAIRESLDRSDPAFWMLQEDHDARVQRKETRVNRALAKRNKWKKRACDKCRNAVRRMEA